MKSTWKAILGGSYVFSGRNSTIMMHISQNVTKNNLPGIQNLALLIHNPLKIVSQVLVKIS